MEDWILYSIIGGITLTAVILIIYFVSSRSKTKSKDNLKKHPQKQIEKNINNQANNNVKNTVSNKKEDNTQNSNSKPAKNNENKTNSQTNPVPIKKVVPKKKEIPKPPPPPPLPKNIPLKPVDELRLKANKAFKYHDYREAINLYNEAIKLDENNPILYANRAAAYNGLNLFHAGLADAQKAVDLDPTYIKGYIRLANAYEGNLRWSFAIEAYEGALKLEPDNKGIQKRIQELHERIDNPDSLEAIVGPETAKKIHMSPLLHDNYGNPVFLKMLKEIMNDSHAMSKYTGQPLYEEFMKIFMLT